MIDKFIVNPVKQMPISGWIFWVMLFIGVTTFLTREYLLYKKDKKKYSLSTFIRESRKSILLSVLVLYMAYVFSIAVIVRERTPQLNYHLVPFWSWFRAVEEVQKYNIWGMPLQILYNVIAFLPIGCLLNLARNVKPIKALLCGFCFSAIIEFSQLIFVLGDFEWDDMIHNALGCMIGAWLCQKLVEWHRHKRRQNSQ